VSPADVDRELHVAGVDQLSHVKSPQRGESLPSCGWRGRFITESHTTYLGIEISKSITLQSV
jgi:hypothetical protein